MPFLIAAALITDVCRARDALRKPDPSGNDSFSAALRQVALFWPWCSAGPRFLMSSFIGIILLMGSSVKKNAIMMIDFRARCRTPGRTSPEEAVYKACIIRFRPILMTTMAALLGALPLAIGLEHRLRRLRRPHRSRRRGRIALPRF